MRRRFAPAIAGLVLLPLLMGAQSSCHSNSSGTSNAQPSHAATIGPTPLPTPGTGAAVGVNPLPAPVPDAAPKPLFPPNKCASVAYPADTGLRVDTLNHQIVGTVDTSCIAPPPQSVITQLEIWGVDGFNVNEIPGGYGEHRGIPKTWPDYSTYTIRVHCTPGTYVFEFAVTWLDVDGTTGDITVPSLEEGTVTTC